jgi:beta-lactamase regulating signal transducer with metallopeptidase domain
VNAIIIERGASLLASASLKSFVILGIAALIVILWRKSSASARHVVWTAAVSATIALPLLAALTPTWTLPGVAFVAPAVFTPAVSTTNPSTAQQAISGDRVAMATPLATAEPRSAAISQQLPALDAASKADGNMAANDGLITPPRDAVTTAPPLGSASTPITPTSASPVFSSLDWKRTASLIWLAGFAVLLLPIAIAHLRLRRIAATARVVRRGKWMATLAHARSSGRISRHVMLLESDEAAMPMTWGVFSPVLLLPAGAEAWPEWKRRNILLHELAHVERFDCLSQLVAQLACALYWFNPLVWVAARRMRVERELACDDRVIGAGSRASEYAGHLLDVARSLRPARATAHAAIAMARPSQLTGRLVAVLDHERNRDSASPRFRVAVAAATLGLLGPVASFNPWVAEAVAAPLAEASRTALRAESSSDVPRSSVATSANGQVVELPPVAISARSAVTAPFVQMMPTPSIPPSFAASAVAPIFPIIKAVQSSDGALGIVAATPVASQGMSCWEGRKDRSTSIHTSDDDSPYRGTTVRFSAGDCSLELKAEGDFTLRPDLSDVATLDRNGLVTIEERDGSERRRMEIRQRDGSLEHLYFVNGRSAPYTPEARAWLATTLLAVERRTAFAAKTRVPQLFQSGGVQRVLQEVSLMGSDHTKSAYLSTLLRQDYNLDASTLTRIVEQATREMNSDHYLSEVFNRVGSQRRADERTWRAFADAAIRMKSDHYKAQVIGNVLSRDRLEPSTVATLLRASASIKSDHYQAETLKKVSKRYAVTAQTRPYYVAALASISSDHYKQEVLSFLNSDDPVDPATTAAVLNSIGDMKSDHYKAEALGKILKGGRLPAAARNEFFAVVRTINSDHYKHKVLENVLAVKPLTRELVAEVLAVAPTLKSDYALSGLLSSLVRAYPIDDSLRPAYDRAVDSISSDYYRGAALSAARPRGSTR